MALLSLSRSKNSEVRYFNQLPNFFFEDLGNTRLYHEDWKLVSYVDLNENLQVEKSLTQAISIVGKACKQLNDTRCIENIVVVNRQIARISKERKRLYSSLGYERNIRNKRGVFDFVGEISKILFGTMSANDATYYNSEIDKLYADNKRITTLIKNQTQILKLSIQNTENLANEVKKKKS